MRFKYNICIVACIFIMLFTSCDPEYCSRDTFVNNSNHRISVLAYSFGQIDGKVSIINALTPGNRVTLEASFCNIGYTIPFASAKLNDSIVLIFNDTLRVLLLDSSRISNLFGEKNPLLGHAWKEVKRPNADDGGTVYFEYEFTNWHFEQAVEFSRR